MISMRRILVTGGTGYIGRAVVSQLIRQKELVVDVLCRDVSKAMPRESSANYINLAGFGADAGEYDVVLHLAAYISAERDRVSANRLVESNIAFGATLLADINIKKGGLFVDTGTFAELHKGRGGKGNYLYAETKKAFEHIARFYSQVNDFNYCKVFPYTVISTERETEKLIDLLLSSIGSDKPIEMTKGEQILDFVDRDDVSSIFQKIALEKDLSALDGARLPCCTGVGTSIRELARIIGGVSGSKLNITWGAKSYRERDILEAVGDPSVAMRLLGWRAESDLKSIIERIVN